jgi:hypothetical protein
MVFPIVTYPSIVTMHSVPFGRLLSAPQRVHFQRYLTGLLVSDNVTVTGINALFVERKDQSALNRFLTAAPWSVTSLNEARIQMMRQKLLAAQPRQGCLVIDDTLAHKYGPCMAGVGEFYDHSQGRVTLAQDVVTTFLVMDDGHFPVDLALYYQFRAVRERAALQAQATAALAQGDLTALRSYLVALLDYKRRRDGFRTKLVLAAQLVDQAVERQLPFTLVLFDAWFLDKTLIARIERTGKAWIGECKSDRIIFVAKERLSVAAFCQRVPATSYHSVTVGETTYWAFSKVVRMSTLGKVRLTFSFDNPALSGEPRYLVTRQLHWNASSILNSYDKRRQTEPFYRAEKHDLGFEACQLRDEQGTIRHWYLTFLAYSFCQLEIALSRQGKGAKASLETVGDCCRQANDELVRALVWWISRRIEQGDSAAAVLQRLFGALPA